MRMRSVVTLSNAAWREAVRQREAFVDVDHLLLGLLAAGGPAAHLLAHHGLTLAAGRRAARECQAATLASLGVDAGALPATRPRPTHELHRAAAGHAPLTERSRRLLDGLGRRGVERELLRALLAEPSGTIPEVLARAGVDPSAVAAGLRNTTDWDTPTPRHVSTDAPTGDGRTTTAVALEHFVAAPAAVLHRVISEPELVRQWTMWRPESRVCDGELVDATSSRGRTHTHRLVRVRDEADGVRWRESWNDRPGGWFDVQLEPLDNGTRVLLTRGIRTFGHLAPLLRWPARVLTGLGLPTAVQNVSFACADLMDESDR